MALFYANDIFPHTKVYTLTEEESKHCIKVLRNKISDPIFLLDGVGNTYEGIILSDHPKKCTIEIHSCRFEPLEKSIHLVLAPTKNLDRMEWLVEKGTELGCTRFSFVTTEHSERSQLKLDRLEKIAIAAMKQSKRAHLPKLDELIPLRQFIADFPKGWVAHCDASQERGVINASEHNRILIGPEGDFSPSEIDFICKAGYLPVTLGTARLRTETAAIRGIIALDLA